MEDEKAIEGEVEVEWGGEGDVANDLSGGIDDSAEDRDQK